MKKDPVTKYLYTAWGVLFALCALMGLFREDLPTLKGFGTFLSVVFFLPPAAVLYRALKQEREQDRLLVRNLAALSLGLTLVLLVLNFLSVLGSRYLGDLLYYLLAVVSAPMVCGGYWVLSLFGWACLLAAALRRGKTSAGKDPKKDP